MIENEKKKVFLLKTKKFICTRDLIIIFIFFLEKLQKLSVIISEKNYN